MKKRVTVIPSDHVIFVDGLSLRFPFDAPENLHALQWQNGTGEVELTDSANQKLSEQDYAEKVAPYVAAWEREKARRDAQAGKEVAEARTPQRLAESVRRERNARIAATDYLMLPDSPLTEEGRAAWRQYRAALRDMTQLDGFPWDGPESAPWPVRPLGGADARTTFSAPPAALAL